MNDDTNPGTPAHEVTITETRPVTIRRVFSLIGNAESCRAQAQYRIDHEWRAMVREGVTLGPVVGDTRAAIYAAVIAAMQPAEEMGGPEGAEYLALMRDIESAARARVAGFCAAQAQNTAPGAVIPARYDPTTIDDDTDGFILRPAHVIEHGSAFWLEPIPGPGRHCLCSAPLWENGAIDWAAECEVDSDECPDYAAIVARLESAPAATPAVAVHVGEFAFRKVAGALQWATHIEPDNWSDVSPDNEGTPEVIAARAALTR